MLLVCLTQAAGYPDFVRQASPPPDPPGVQTLSQPAPSPAFSLIDQDRAGFTPARLLGKWTIMMFGYTHCPDFCPTTLTAFNTALRRLEKDSPKLASDTQVVFVSVDPFRDSPEILKDFVGHFNAQFIGLSGPPMQLHRLADPLGMSYDYADIASGEPLGDTLQAPQQDYTVNHGAGFYVFDDKARVVAWALPPHTADRITAVYKFIRNRYE